MKTPRGRVALILLIVFFCCFSEAGAQNSPHANSGYTPQRVYDANEKRYTDFESMLAELARLDVVFVGEQHDDPNTHRLERAILEGLSRRRPQLVVAMEMFERDVQKSLDDYLAGQLSEEAFLAASRPWPRYQTDYRPLVEFARAHRYRVIAANAPTQLARQIARGGLEALAQMSPEDRAMLAKEIQCPLDDYYKRFAQTMTAHPGAAAHGSAEQSSDAQQKAILERFYYAQCVKDETMAESVARLNQGGAEPGPLTVHFNGAFHSDYRQGAAARVIQRMPKTGVKVLTIIPVDDLDALKPDDYRQRGDYLVFTLKPFNPSTTTGK